MKTPSYVQIPSVNLRFLLIIVLVLGIVFRFSNLDKKNFWLDEAINSSYSSGYTKVEVIQQVQAWDGQQVSLEDLHKFQSPNADKISLDVIKALANEEPQNPPVYYLLSRWWMQLFGTSVVVRKSLSVLISLLAFPLMYWLALELFDSPVTGWIAMALLAISPFHLLYAQEVRHYVAWTVIILLSSAVFLRAIRLNKKLPWVMYASTLTLGLYTFPFSALVAMGHGIYVVINERFKPTKILIAYFVSTMVSILAFSPWLLAIIENSHKMYKWRKLSIPFPIYLNSLVTNTSRVFLDLTPEDIRKVDLANIPLSLSLARILIVILVIYAIYFVCRHTYSKIWLFIVTLIGITTLTLVIPDFIFGGIRGLMMRYLIPSYLGIELAVAFLLATKITSHNANIWQQKIWQIATLALIGSGVISSGIISQSPSWWHQYKSYNNPHIAEIINQSEAPIVGSDLESLGGMIVGHIVSLSYLLEPEVKYQFFPSSQLNNITDETREIFLLNPSEKLQQSIEDDDDLTIEPVFQGSLSLMKLRQSDR